MLISNSEEMLLILFCVIFTTVNAQNIFQNGQRKSRQLDLGLENSNNINETIQKTKFQPSLENFLTKDYLPPISLSSAPQSVVEAQSQQTLKAIENTICNPPFDSIFCKLKDASLKSETIFKPSRDLIPPLNDVEGNQQFEKKEKTSHKSENFSKDQNSKENYSVFSAVSHSNFAATTRKPVTEIPKLQKSTQSINLKNLGNEKVGTKTFNKAESTNSLRSYLPPEPENSGAAQTSVEVVRPPDSSQDHHHHHDHQSGHHGHHHSGDICSDAFHSFLCAPLKARKRITGALPNSLKVQSSNIQYQKVFPFSDKETVSSNSFQNEYLALKSQPASTVSAIKPIYQPSQKTIVTTTTISPTISSTKFIPQSSNENERFYLPPALSNNIPASEKPILPTQLFKKLPTVSTQASLIQNTAALEQSKVINQNLASTINPISTISLATTTKPIIIENRVPEPTSQQQYVSFTTEKTLFSTSAPLFSNENNFYLPPKFNPQSAASFISTTTNFYPKTTTPFPKLPKFQKASTSTLLRSSTVLSSTKPKIQPALNIITTTVKPFSTISTYSTTRTPVSRTTDKSFITLPNISKSRPINPPLSNSKSASNLISTTIKPVSTTQAVVRQPEAYLPPDPNYQPAAAQVDAAAVAAPQAKNPFHHGRDLCTDPFHSFLCLSPKPRKRITGTLPSGLRFDSANINEKIKPAPSFQNINKIKLEKSLETFPTSGYNLLKTDNIFTAQSKSIISTTAAPTSEYFYPKPDKEFPLPSQQKEVVKSLTTKSSTIKRPLQTVLSTSEARVTKGYEYPKPEIEFSFPSQQSSTSVYATSKPLVTGYTYPKPQKAFPLPTEQKEIRLSTTLRPTSSNVIVPQPSNEIKGYQYTKPQKSFNLPETKGYFYPKPEKRLELPVQDNKPKSLTPSPNSSPNIFGTLESAEFIPVNKLDKREDSSILAGLRRFGERLRKRERKY